MATTEIDAIRIEFDDLRSSVAGTLTQQADLGTILQTVVKDVSRQQSYLSAPQIQLQEKLATNDAFHVAIGDRLNKLEEDIRHDIKKSRWKP